MNVSLAIGNQSLEELEVVIGRISSEVGREPWNGIDVEEKVAHRLHLFSLLPSQEEFFGKGKEENLKGVYDPHHKASLVRRERRSQRDGGRNPGKELKT